MISTADSLLILSATELSGSLFAGKKTDDLNEKSGRMLRKQRITTALLAVVALALSYISPSKLIFTLVSYVWAGIGCTFSVVIILTLFWKRFHGKAALVTVVTGLLFTIFWISGGFEQHYSVTRDKAEFLVNQNVLTDHESAGLLNLEGKRFVNVTKFENAVRDNISGSESEGKLAVVVSSCTVKGVPARLTTFIIALIVAIVSTYAVRPWERIKGNNE
jgi:Na+(H+)/acetate symporter ActP